MSKSKIIYHLFKYLVSNIHIQFSQLQVKAKFLNTIVKENKENLYV